MRILSATSYKAFTLSFSQCISFFTGKMSISWDKNKLTLELQVSHLHHLQEIIFILLKLNFFEYSQVSKVCFQRFSIISIPSCCALIFIISEFDPDITANFIDIFCNNLIPIPSFTSNFLNPLESSLKYILPSVKIHRNYNN